MSCCSRPDKIPNSRLWKSLYSALLVHIQMENVLYESDVEVVIVVIVVVVVVVVVIAIIIWHRWRETAYHRTPVVTVPHGYSQIVRWYISAEDIWKCELPARWFDHP